jgi:HSP20 family protein
MLAVKLNDEKAKEALVQRGFELPLFRGSLFNMNPFTLMRRFTEDMDRVFRTVPGTGETLSWSPTVEVREVNGKLLVSAELPGLKKGDIKVQVTEDTLILEGERKQEKEEKREGYYHSERSYGHFYRSIPLPEGATLDKAAAEFTNGILEVSIPVAETKQKPREVPVYEGGKGRAAGG